MMDWLCQELDVQLRRMSAKILSIPQSSTLKAEGRMMDMGLTAMRVEEKTFEISGPSS